MRPFLRSQPLTDPLLLAPDVEAEQWVAALARSLDWDYAVMEKQRRGDRDVVIRLPRLNVRGREVILVDDIASTCMTLATASCAVRRAGAGTVHCLVTHALFGDEALTLLDQAGVDSIWTTDSIAHPTNVIPLAGLLARAVISLR